MIKTSIYEKVAFNIKRYRKINNVTTKELAKRTGYSYAYIRRIESNSKKTFSILTVSVIANALNIDIKCLFDDIDI